jgi:hypothetical protein
MYQYQDDLKYSVNHFLLLASIIKSIDFVRLIIFFFGLFYILFDFLNNFVLSYAPI